MCLIFLDFQTLSKLITAIQGMACASILQILRILIIIIMGVACVSPLKPEQS